MSLTGRDRTREVVRLRDNHTCRACSEKWQVGQRRFDIHHLSGLCGLKSRSYDRVSDIDDLITLCHRCHFNHHQASEKLKNSLIKNPAAVELGRKGGLKTKKRFGKDHYKRIGKMGRDKQIKEKKV